MAAVNSIISKADYNNIRNKLINVLGTGSGDSGWGQMARILSPAVTESSKVSSSDWGKLRYDVINSYKHIFGTTPTTAQVNEGYKIRYSNTFVPDAGPSPSNPTRTDAPVTQYNDWVDTIVANRFTVGAGQYATTSVVSGTRTWNSTSYPTSWTSKIYCEVRIEFATADQARYFFNSGGLVKISSSRDSGSGSLGTSQCTAWTTLLNSAGTRSFGGNTPGTGTSPLDGQNWYRLNTSDQTWYSLSGSSPYGANTYRINARCNTLNNSTGSANIGYFVVEYIDNYTDPGWPPPGDNVDGKFNINVSLQYATGTMVPTGTSDFAVTLPTITIGSFTQVA